MEGQGQKQLKHSKTGGGGGTYSIFSIETLNM
jgi:hypothetical protein